jgi:hypothetical protein
MVPLEGSPASARVALWALLLSVLSVALSGFATMVFLIRLPAGAFSETRRAWPKTLPRLLLRIGTNIAGWVLILLGVVLSVPGVPGQGILTILMGLLLVDFPGRLRLMRTLLSRPAVQRSIDRLRARFGRPPFIW